MIERNPFQQQQQLPVRRPDLNHLAKNRRKRNKLLIALIMAVLIAVMWKWFDPFGRSVPETDSNNIPPLTDLHPIVLAKQMELMTETSNIGISIMVTDGFRSIEEQNELYAQGRSAKGAVVTQVQGGNSYHNYGLAIDFALRTKDGDVIWDMKADGNGNGKSDWMEVVAIAKQLGFTWGGDWKNFPDYPHLQMDFGYSIRDLKRGKRPPAE